MTGKQVVDGLYFYLVGRINALDVAISVAESTDDTDDMKRLRGAHEELVALTEWAAVVETQVRS